jgi:hypothetical protein
MAAARWTCRSPGRHPRATCSQAPGSLPKSWWAVMTASSPCGTPGTRSCEAGQALTGLILVTGTRRANPVARVRPGGRPPAADRRLPFTVSLPGEDAGSSHGYRASHEDRPRTQSREVPVSKLPFRSDASARRSSPSRSASTTAESAAVTVIGRLRPQSYVAVHRMIRSVGTVLVASGTAYHFNLVDGSGELDVLFTGPSGLAAQHPNNRRGHRGEL